ncbi:radical SAM protein [Phaeospirillum tilakii]|uniref:Radical SAM protein n=1 Tax=Phaeospirillum tilakii TaxID=741673 RepID=A0ABW5CC01_9PROT
MEHQAITCVWEVTMGCNMRCKHCGSACTHPLPDELTPDEGLDLCDQLADLGLEWVTLSGGEPFLRPDWEQLVRRLRQRGVIPNMISNGWLLGPELIARARDAGIGTLAISLDGVGETHDYIRKPGSFARSTAALREMIAQGVAAGVITTVQRRNIDQLPAILALLLEIGIDNWQVQIGLPMGSFADPANRDMLLPPEAVDRVIAFIHAHSDDPRIHIYPADCIGYYNRKEIEARSRAFRSAEPVYWRGCNAGKRSFGILHNGDVLGCTSIRDRAFIEGNLRQRTLRAIWEDPERFAWSRSLRKEDLAGTCRSCRYGALCLGGCPNTRLTIRGDIHADNPYCSYAVALDRAAAELAPVEDVEEMRAMAERLTGRGEYQLAGMVLEKLLERRPDDVAALAAYGYVSYRLDNLDRARAANERALALDPDNIYVTKGLGVVMHAQGRSEEGIAHLRRAVALGGESPDLDSYHDLAVVYLQSGREDEARDLLDQVDRLAPGFRAAHPELDPAVRV